MQSATGMFVDRYDATSTERFDVSYDESGLFLYAKLEEFEPQFEFIDKEGCDVFLCLHSSWTLGVPGSSVSYALLRPQRLLSHQ
jgi:hypothetical protein